ncbi:MAG: hypothetical protein GY940_09450 [bacterium]|nr:hypothetical protein [bacterium]
MNTLDYKIPKIQVTAEILVDYRTAPEVEEYILFLNEFSRYRKGKETIYEFLSQKKQFIPLKDCKTGEFIAMNVDDIVYVREKEKSSPQPEQSKVTLYLRANFILEVEHFNPLPDSQSRVLDYLNQEGQFILFRQGEQKIFVNKQKIIKVKEG